MLTGRQKQILSIFIENYSKANVITSNIIAYELEVTTKTVQNDIRAINDELVPLRASIGTVAGKGYILKVRDEKAFMDCIELISNKSESSVSLDNKEDRVKYICGQLIFSKKPVLSNDIADSLFISRSLFSMIIKSAKEMLQKYDIEIVSKSKKGLSTEGSEFNKRLFFFSENQNAPQYLQNIFPEYSRSKVSDAILKSILNEKYEISDNDLQNFIVYVEICLMRMKSGFMLNEYNDSVRIFPNSHEYRIAENILYSLKKEYLVEFNEYEVANLASMINSIRIKTANTAISEETEIFVIKLLHSIKKQFGMDFLGDLELRLNLSLHITPLIQRAKNNLLAINTLLDSIKQSLTLAYDMANVSINLIEKEYNIKLNEDEAGYLALYYAIALNHLRKNGNQKRVLIITSTRKSEMLLLQHNFNKNFGDKITSLEIIQANELSTKDAKNYDCVFTTTYPGLVDTLRFNAIHIDYFLSDKDIATITNELKKTSGQNPLTSYFDSQLFFHNPKVKTKEELIKFMCEKMNDLFDYDSQFSISFLQNVTNRENNAPTVFTNGVALPHPEMPFTTETKACVSILDEPIEWNGKNVQIVFLLNVKKDGESEMELLYSFLSDFISNKKKISQLKENPTFSTLRSQLIDFVPTNQYDYESI